MLPSTGQSIKKEVIVLALRDYQLEALELIESTFSDGSPRATLQMPCGTGKTYIAAGALSRRSGHCLMFVPSIALLSQTLRVLSAQLPQWRFIAVCSDNQVGDDIRTVDVINNASSRLLEVTTNVQHLVDVLSAHKNDNVLVISTYASSAVISESSHSWNLMVLDEAHHTAGVKDRVWSIPMSDELISARNRLFMTATTRNVRIGDDDEFEVISMDSVQDYGPQISTLSWRDAINRKILSDYEVAIIGVKDSSVHALMKELHQAGSIISAESAAAQLALLRAQELRPEMKSVLAFHNRVQDSINWSKQLEELACVDGRAETLHVRHIDAQTHSSERESALHQLRNTGDTMTVVSNCRVLGEGVDVPALDAVMFAAARSSANDLIQIVGRALRKHPDGDDKKSLIIIPVIESDDDTLTIDTKLAHSRYAFCWRLLIALSEIDSQVSQSVIARLVSENSHQDNNEDNSIVIDTSDLAEHVSYAFELRILSKIVSHHVITAELLKEYAAINGHAEPAVSETFGKRDYPLGQRVRAAKMSYKNNTLDSAYIKLYEEIPNFEWSFTKKRNVISDESYVEMIEQFVSQTGISTIRYGQNLTDAATGISVPIGKKANDWKWIKQLEPSLKKRVKACIKN